MRLEAPSPLPFCGAVSRFRNFCTNVPYEYREKHRGRGANREANRGANREAVGRRWLK